MRASYFIPLLFSASLMAAEAPPAFVEEPTPEHVGAERRMTALWNEARDLVRQQQYPAALRNYFRVFNFSRGAQTLALARLSVLPAEIAALGEQHPPAIQALRDEVRDRAGLILGFIAGTDELLEYVALNRALGEPERTVQLYDQLKNMGERAREQRLRMREVIAEELLDAGRVAELGELTVAMARGLVRRINELQTETDFSAASSPARAAYLKALRSSVVTDGVRIYGALLAMQRDELAARLAQHITSFDSNFETWATLIRTALQNNRPDAARKLTSEAESKLGSEAGAKLRGML